MFNPAWLTPVPEEARERGDGEFIAKFADAFATITKDSVAGGAGQKLELRDWQRELLTYVFARDEDGGLRHRGPYWAYLVRTGKVHLARLSLPLLWLTLKPTVERFIRLQLTGSRLASCLKTQRK